MNLRFSPEAGRELAEARGWYEERHAGLGERFQRSFDAAAEAIAQHPEMYRVVYGTRRRAFLRGFPYFLVYQIVEETVVVLGCMHFSRSPSIWKRRSEQ